MSMTATLRVALGLLLALASPTGPASAQAPKGEAQEESGTSKLLVYIDTDMANEVDDPYAVYRALVAPEFEVVGLSSVGWNGPRGFPANTRESQTLIEDVLGLMDLADRIPHPIGALNPMPAADSPVDSPAARDIIARAKAAPAGRKLQVFVLGAYTNVASALLIAPEIKDKIAVHVMGFNLEDGQLKPTEFNTQGDPLAAAHLLKCGVELNVMPNTTTGPFLWAKADVDAHFKGRGGVPDYLVQRWESHAPNDKQRVLWDIAVFEAILRPELATRSEIVQDGNRIGVWTKIDIERMRADYWAATKPAEADATSSDK